MVTVGKEETLLAIPPPEPAEFPEKVQFVTVGEQLLSLYIPPPIVVAVFPEKMQLVSVGEEEPKLNIAPP